MSYITSICLITHCTTDIEIVQLIFDRHNQGRLLKVDLSSSGGPKVCEFDCWRGAYSYLPEGVLVELRTAIEHLERPENVVLVVQTEEEPSEVLRPKALGHPDKLREATLLEAANRIDSFLDAGSMHEQRKIGYAECAYTLRQMAAALGEQGIPQPKENQ